MKPGGLRVAVVAGVRTAFQRRGTGFARRSAVELGAAVVREVVARAGVEGEDRFNVMGGSIALGHPFAATGARQIVQAARELGRRGGGLACVAACAAGGLGAAIVIES